MTINNNGRKDDVTVGLHRRENDLSDLGDGLKKMASMISVMVLENDLITSVMGMGKINLNDLSESLGK